MFNLSGHTYSVDDVMSVTLHAIKLTLMKENFLFAKITLKICKH